MALMSRWCQMLNAGCNIAGTSKQEDLGQGIVRGTLGAQSTGEIRLAMPTNVFSLPGQVTGVEGGAYVLQDISGVEHA